MYERAAKVMCIWTILGTLVLVAVTVQVHFILDILSTSQSPSDVATASPTIHASQDEPTGAEIDWGSIGKVLLAILVIAMVIYMMWRFIANPWGWRLSAGSYKVRTKAVKALDQALGTNLIDSGIITLGNKNAHLSLSWKDRWDKEAVLDALMVMAATTSDADALISATRGITIREPSKRKRERLTVEALQCRLLDRLSRLCVEQDVTTTITTPIPKNKKSDTTWLKSLPVDQVYGPLAQVLALTQGTPYDAILDTRARELRLRLKSGTTMARALYYTQIIDAAAELGLGINRTKQLGSLTSLTALLPATETLPELPSMSAAVAPLTEAIELGADITGDEAAQLGLELPSPDPTSQDITWFAPTPIND